MNMTEPGEHWKTIPQEELSIIYKSSHKSLEKGPGHDSCMSKSLFYLWARRVCFSTMLVLVHLLLNNGYVD